MTRYHGGERYRHPERPVEIHVSHPNPALDEPPAPDVGEILSVDFEYTNACAGRHQFIRCQACRTSIHWPSEHTFAFVFIYAPEDSAMRGNYKHVHLCDRECWREWAHATSVEQL